MLNLTKYEKIFLILLIGLALIGLGLRAYSISSRKIDIGVVSSYISKDSDVNKFIREYKLININKASLDDLARIPGVGPGLANRIMEYRNNHGLFVSIDDIKNVEGIGDKKFKDMRDYITTE